MVKYRSFVLDRMALKKVQ